MDVALTSIRTSPRPNLGSGTSLNSRTSGPPCWLKTTAFMRAVVYPAPMTNKKDVMTVAVIGGGIMGRGIAHVSAMGGFITVLNDISDDLLQKAQDQIRRDLEHGVEIGKLT